ncbi:MAG: hypothetical protein GY723_13090 [bacterium]|nr:hypothetical protein [bacterium]MCP5065638.1 hypothetical protein [bacterium]
MDALCTFRIGALVALAAVLSCSERNASIDVAAGPPEQVAPERDPGWASLAQRGEGFLVWESNRTGSWRIWTRELDGSGLRQLSPEEPDRDHFGAHISPDGTRVAYLSYPKGSNSYHHVKERIPVELHVLLVSDGEERVVAQDARSYGQSRSVVWIDGHRLVYLAHDRSTRELDLRTGGVTHLADAPEGTGPYLLNPTKTHGTGNDPVFSAYDPEALTFSAGPRRAGCQPYFSRDGRFGFWTTHSGGPIMRMDLASERQSTIINSNDPRLAEGFRYVYFPMVSPDQRLLAYGASGGDHDHFRADYEIFVAPVNPMTLELEGKPVRYTFDPATDRFPDAFLAGLEFGHLGGEVPFRVEIDPEHVGPEHDSGDPWRWEFGDGATSKDAIGRHTFESAGKFTLVARRDDQELHARVDVVPSAPPRPLRTTAREREVSIAFDEPIEANSVVATLDSGTAVTGVSVDPDRHTLRVRVEDTLPASDRLHLAGVRDRTGHVASTFTLEVERSSWPRRSDGLVFLFGTGADKNRVRDPRSGREVVYPLASRGRARFDHDQALALAGGAFEAQGAGAAVARTCSDAGAITIEMLIRPGNAREDGFPLIASLEDEEGRWLLQLGQRHDQLRLRMLIEEAAPVFSVASVEPLDPIHLVVSYRDGRLVSYRNERKVLDTDRIRGDLSQLGQASLLLFGSDSAGKHDWSGTLEGIAIYCRFMEGEEAAANAHAYLKRVSDREVIPRLRVRARLVAVSDAPTLKEIAPYREALTVYEWEVLRVIDGELGQDRVRVAHWAVLGGVSQPVASLRPGAELEIELERMADNKQANSAVLSDDLELDADLSLFIDVGP